MASNSCIFASRARVTWSRLRFWPDTFLSPFQYINIKFNIIVNTDSFYRATHMYSAVYAVCGVCLSVCLSQ